MRKIAILFVSLFVVCSLSKAQHLSDSTKYYLDMNDNNAMSALKICIENIHEWNLKNYHKNGIINIYVSNNDSSCYMKVIHFYPKNDSVDIIPDYYSYVDGQIVFWYLGKFYLSAKEDTDFKLFIADIYSKYAAKSDKISQTPKEEINIKPQQKRDLDNIPKTISVEDMKNLPIIKAKTPITNLIPKPSTYVIKKTKSDGRVSVLEEKMIY